jgi:hypothetical protein
MLRHILAMSIMVAATGCSDRKSQDPAAESATPTQQASAVAASENNDKKSYSKIAEDAVAKVLSGDRLWAVLNRR